MSFLRWFRPKVFVPNPTTEEIMKKVMRKVMNEEFQRALAEILKHEGGWVNDPDDPGGETNYGITKKTALAHGYTGSMKDIPMSTVEEIYKKSYWDCNNGDKVCAYAGYDVALELFDASVNTGSSRAAKWFQLMLNMMNRDGASWNDVTVDGDIGPGTLAQLKKMPEKDRSTAVKVLKAQRARHYMDIVQAKRSQEKYLRGWMNRVFK